MKNSQLIPIHPGEKLRTEFLEPLSISASELSQHLQIELSVIQELIAERTRLTVDLAYRLYFYFGISLRYWLNLQREYDLATYPAQESLKKQIKPYPWEQQEIWNPGVNEIA